MRLIIDCSYLCYRSLHTIAGLTNEEKPVGIIFGFIRQILKLAKDFKTNKFIFCWDSKQSYRKLVYPEYKAHRHKDMTDQEREDLIMAFEQFNTIRTAVLPYMGFSNIFHQTGYEADDLIAWIAARFPDDTVIVSADNDLFQLLLSHRFCPVQIWNFKILNSEERFSKDWFGLKPIDWVKVKAIAGCNSDNIAGVPGVGEISAAKYVAGMLRGKRLDDINASQDIIKRNMDLVALPYYGRKAIGITGIQPDTISSDKFRVTFGQYGFRSLLSGDEIKKWEESFFKG